MTHLLQFWIILFYADFVQFTLTSSLSNVETRKHPHVLINELQIYCQRVTQQQEVNIPVIQSKLLEVRAMYERIQKGQRGVRVRTEKTQKYLWELNAIYVNLNQFMLTRSQQQIPERSRSVHFDTTKQRTSKKKGHSQKQRSRSRSRERSRSRIRKQLQSSDYTCPICDVFSQDASGKDLSFHHLVPVARNDWFREKYPNDPLVTNDKLDDFGIFVCKQCHDKVHELFGSDEQITNQYLAEYYNTKEKLLQVMKERYLDGRQIGSHTEEDPDLYYPHHQMDIDHFSKQMEKQSDTESMMRMLEEIKVRQIQRNRERRKIQHGSSVVTMERRRELGGYYTPFHIISDRLTCTLRAEKEGTVCGCGVECQMKNCDVTHESGCPFARSLKPKWLMDPSKVLMTEEDIRAFNNQKVDTRFPSDMRARCRLQLEKHSTSTKVFSMWKETDQTNGQLCHVILTASKRAGEHESSYYTVHNETRQDKLLSKLKEQGARFVNFDEDADILQIVGKYDIEIVEKLE